MPSDSATRNPAQTSPARDLAHTHPAGANPPDEVSRGREAWAAFHELTRQYRDRADVVAPYARAAARAWRDAAALLEAALVAADDAVLSIAAAAREGGWSYEGLRRRVARDPALNAGTARAPRITRAALRRLGSGRGAVAPGAIPARDAERATSEAARGAAPTSPSAGPSRIAAIVASAVDSRRAAGERA